jgi:hypothetical protein
MIKALRAASAKWDYIADGPAVRHGALLLDVSSLNFGGACGTAGFFGSNRHAVKPNSARKFQATQNPLFGRVPARRGAPTASALLREGELARVTGDRRRARRTSKDVFLRAPGQSRALSVPFRVYPPGNHIRTGTSQIVPYASSRSIRPRAVATLRCYFPHCESLSGGFGLGVGRMNVGRDEGTVLFGGRTKERG